ncbi:MAG: hypothetical protein COA38_20600 [Fluviicola sp.]|nr:MAG: hypothetical protein COA38_20600 [Fluviicola sp.]
MIAVLDAANAPHIRLPLWADPAIQEANDKEALSAYEDTGDAAALHVPDDATIVTIRALSAAQMGVAERAAGRRTQLGAVMHLRRDKYAEDFRVVDENGDERKPTPDEELSAVSTWIDDLCDSDYAAFVAFSEWYSRQNYELAKAATVCITHSEMGVVSFERFMDCVVDRRLKESLIAEVSYRAKAHAGLGIRPKGLSNSVSGSVKLNGSAPKVTGNVMGAMTDCDDNAAIVAAASLTI